MESLTQGFDGLRAQWGGRVGAMAPGSRESRRFCLWSAGIHRVRQGQNQPQEEQPVPQELQPSSGIWVGVSLTPVTLISKVRFLSARG